jgi:hypothetical protein
LNEQLRRRIRASRHCAARRIHDFLTFLKLGNSVMSSPADDAGVPDSAELQTIQPAPWARVTGADVQGLDFEAPIAGTSAAETQELSDLFRSALQSSNGSAEPDDTPIARTFTMLCALSGMYFKPDERNEPFGPMVTLVNGSRSAIPSDFQACIEVLADMAHRAANPVLLARLADVCWLLDRKRGKLAAAAISAYVDIVQRTKRGDLKFRFEQEIGALEHPARDYLCRALSIGRAIGWNKPETMAARELVVELRKQAIEKQALLPIVWFCDLDLDFAVSDPGDTGADLDRVLAAPPPDTARDVLVELWRIAARAYHLAKRNDNKHRCQIAAAECLADEALATNQPAMRASHLLSIAISELHGIPGQRDRRTELCHKLVDIQARVPDEMSEFSRELDLQEIAQRVQKAVAGRVGFIDKLFVFADLAASPEPGKLAEDAAKSIRKHPLSSIFGTSHLDREGKVIHRSEGAGFGDANEAAVRQQIAQAEGIRRMMAAFGQIEPARHAILETHYISDDVFAPLLRQSPFVPPGLVLTFSRGFARFFQGDFVGATYILTPLLENSLRYVLKTNGLDVSIFDDATKTQQDRTISSLFEQMRPDLDRILTTRITTDIESVFLTKLGPHIRHAVAHGLLRDGDPYGADAIYGCWLIFRLCLAPLFGHRDQLKLSIG